MRKTGLMIIAVMTAFLMACGGAAENKPASNAAANTAAKTAAAPTADALLDMEKKANEAYGKGEAAYFEGMLSDKVVMSMGKDRMGKAAIIEMIKTAKCENFQIKLSEPQISKINDDTYAFTYKNESTGKCTEDGGKMADLKPMRASTVWVRSGDKWQAVWHAETPIMAAPAADKKDEKAPEAKKEEPKAEAPKPAEPKKDETKPAANANAAAPAPAKLTPSANTEALGKTHAAGWEAFRNKDAKWFDANLAATFAFVNPAGSYTGNKAETIKIWTETMKCEGITKTSFTDTFAAAISPTVEILFGKGNADGTCDGQKNGDLWQTAVYVKEGEAWKLAFMFETLGM